MKLHIIKIIHIYVICNNYLNLLIIKLFIQYNRKHLKNIKCKYSFYIIL